MKTGLTVLALVAATTTGHAGAQALEKGRDCFYSRNINGFTAVDDETINVRVGVRDIYQLKFLGPSRDVRWANGIALVSHGGSFICSSLDATVVVPGPTGPQRFPVKAIRHLTPDEVANLPRKQRP